MSDNVQNLNEVNRRRNQNGVDESQAHLEIAEHPQSRGFRFRYQCEGTSHGGLQGEGSRRDHKTYPALKIVGFKGPARITVTLVTDENVPRPHAHELIGKNCNNGICVVDLKGDHMTATFPNLGIRHVTKRKVVDILSERIVEAMKVDKMMAGGVGYDPERVLVSGEERERAHKQAEDQAKSMSLNTVRLCFQAYLQDLNGTFSKMLPSVISNPIYDSKSPGAAALKICRMDKHAGCCLGNDEVFMLCDKVQKDDIAVRFFEEDEDGHVKWQGYGQFGPADVHRQYAIVFKTPPYWNADIDRHVQVQVQLVRMSDQESSDPKPFTYYPQQRDQEEIDKKRRKQIPINFGGGSVPGAFPPSGSATRGFEGLVGLGGSGLSGGGGGGPALNNLQADPPAPREPVAGRAGTPPPDESSRDSHTSYSSMSVSSCELQIDVDTDEAPLDAGDALPSVASSGYCSQLPSLSDLPRPSPLPPQAGVAGKKKEPSSRIKSQPHKFLKQEEDTSSADALKFAWHVAGRTTQALKEYASTGDIVCLLMVQRHLVAIQDEFGDNILHTAIMNNQPEVVCHMLEAIRTIPNNTVINQLNGLRQTPLHIATIMDKYDVVELLLHSGAAMYPQDRHGNTPIHLAARLGRDKCLRLLLAFGTSPLATATKPIPEVDFLNYDGFTPLHLAVARGDLEAVKCLVTDGGCNVDLPDGRSGRTALHHAVDAENLAICGYLLLDAEADSDAPDYDGNTPLHLAAAADYVGIAALLVAAGADPEQENSWVKVEEGAEAEDAGAAGAGVKRKAEEDAPVEEYSDDIVGCTPRDLVIDSDKMIRVLSGESYSQISPMWTQTAGMPGGMDPRTDSLVEDSGISPPGDLDKLDAMVRGKVAAMLDNTSGKGNWEGLAERLGMSALIDPLSLSPSPTRALLDNYEVLDGSIRDLKAALIEMDREDVVRVITQLLDAVSGKEQPKSVADSGFGSVQKSMEGLKIDPC